MSIDIEIVEEKRNPLIERTELKVRIHHLDSGTPNRLELKKKIAAMKNSNENLTIIRNIQTHFGALFDLGTVNIYDNAEELKYYEPFHIQIRNLPPEKRTEIIQLKKKNEPYKHLLDYE